MSHKKPESLSKVAKPLKKSIPSKNNEDRELVDSSRTKIKAMAKRKSAPKHRKTPRKAIDASNKNQELIGSSRDKVKRSVEIESQPMPTLEGFLKWKETMESEPVKAAKREREDSKETYALETAGLQPRLVLEGSDYYRDLPRFAEIIEKAARAVAEKEPGVALRFAEKYMGKPYYAEVLEKAARNAAEMDPVSALSFVGQFKEMPYCGEIVEKAARKAVETEPGVVLWYYGLNECEPYFEELVEFFRLPQLRGSWSS